MSSSEAMAAGLFLFLFVYIVVSNLIAMVLVLAIKPRGKNRFGKPGKPQSFLGAINTCMTRYSDFSGRSSRSEFWWYFFLALLIVTVLNLLDESLKVKFFHFASFGLLLPMLGVSIRRLHDINRRGWWVLLNLCILPVVLYVLWARSAEDDEGALAEVFD